jgi:GTPase
MSKPLVAIVGRPNVGKSTLFNRLIGQRLAIVEDTPGITRDRLYGDSDWNGREFRVVDTGGILMDVDDPLIEGVRQQAEVAMEEADAILFVVDVSEGLHPIDEEVAEKLRSANKPVLLVVNKSDNDRREMDASEFYALGLGDVYPIAAHQGRGVGDMLDALVEVLPAEGAAEEEEDRIRVAIVGRPNVGKSSLLNALVREERSLVSDIPGTTRDVVDTPLDRGDQKFTLIDTAGIRRPGKVQGSIEYYMVLRAERALERSDVGVLVIDAADGVTGGDKRVAGLIHESGRACVIFVNKWDITSEANLRKMTQTLREEMPFLGYGLIVYGSALRKRGMPQLLEAVVEASNAHALRIPTGDLNRTLRDAVDAHPLSSGGRELKLYYATMVGVKPPTIVIFVNDPKLLHFSYQRYLENRLREAYGFVGTPLRLVARKREKEERE